MADKTMSVAYYIALEREVENFDIYVNGKFLSRFEKSLKPIAELLKVKPLIEFFGEDMTDFFEEEGVEIVDKTKLSDKWFSSNEGLETVRQISQHLQNNPYLIENAESIIEELKDFERVLVEAKKHNLKWHLAIDF